jgi:hypothetical protein
MYRAGFLWILDANGNHQWDGTGPGQDVAFPFGGIAGDVPVVGKWFSPPATIMASGGTPQSASVNTAFPLPLSLTAIGSDGFPVNGVTMKFTPPGSGASTTFAGGVNTALTNASGSATSAAVSANGTPGGPYSVTASVMSCGTYPGCPGSANVNFSLTNTTAGTGTITVGNVSVGQNLETQVSINFPTPDQPGSVITISSSNPAVMLIVGQGGVPTQTLTFTDTPGGQNSIGVFVQGVASSGTAILTVSCSGYNTGSGTITATPSGFVLSGPNGIGVPSFSAGQGVSTTLTVTAARLDSSFNYVESQSLAPNVSVNVAVTSAPTSVGTISSSPLAFSSGLTSLTTQFNAVSVGTATLTAVVPAGFSTPANSGNVLAASVTPAGLVPGNASVGKGLETNTNVVLNGVATGGSCSSGGGLTVTISSNNASLLLLAASPTAAGQQSIQLCVNGGLNHTQDFYVYGLASSGTVTFTASAPGFGSANGTVTLTPSGFVVAGPFGLGAPSFPTSTLQPPSTITVYSAQLDGSLNYVGAQPVAGTASVGVTVTSGTTSVGTITTPTVNIAGGSFSATTQFQPLAAGTSVISVSVPFGFSSPAQDATVTADVSLPSFAVTGGVSIGNNLQLQATVVIGQPAGMGGQQVTLTSNNPSQLKLSSTATGTGQTTITVTIPSGSNNTTFYLQAFGSPASTTYTASATGFTPRTGTIQVTASAVVISGPLGQSPFNTTTSSPPTSLTVSMAQLDGSGNFASSQTLAGSLSLTVSLNNTNSGAATVPSSVTITGGSTATANFTPVAVGQATISVVTPTGYSAPPTGYGSITGVVTM